jgi:hypothetical protein
VESTPQPKPNKLKIAVIAVGVVAALYFGDRAISYVKGMLGENKRLHTELIGQTEKYQQLSDHAAKLEVKYSDAKALEERLNKDFAAEKGALEGRIKILSNATFVIRESARKAGKSDLVYQGETVKYVVNEIRFNDGPPVGYVLIFDDGRVVSKIYNNVIDVKTAVARDEDSGKYSIVSKADFILKSPSINQNGEKVWTNVPYPLRINGGTATVDPTEKNPLFPRLRLWAPHLNGGMSAGAGIGGAFVRPTVDASLAGFGRTDNDLDWKFVHLGFDIDTELTDPGFHVIPFSYRFWPTMLTNSYVGPGLGWTKTGMNLQLNLNLTF